MATDFERHEVARLMRDRQACCGDFNAREIAGIIKTLYQDDGVSWGKLADLIDPIGEDGRFDVDRLCFIADQMEEMAEKGAMLTSNGLRRAASVIREATGVDE